jgi:hypothetical protein
MSLLWLYVGRDNASAVRESEAFATYTHGVYRGWTLEASGREAAHAAVWDPEPRRHYLAGDPAFAAEAVRRATASSFPIEHLVVGMSLPGMPDEMVRGSMERFARAVLPVIRED